MRRSKPKAARRNQRDSYGARLRRLREALGFSQREMATDLGVAHGAIGLWETRARTVPGPVRKLIELYEAELGIDDGAARTDTLQKLRTSWAARSLKLAQTAAGVVVRATTAMFERFTATDVAERSAISTTARAAGVRQIADALGELKGFAMKVGQMLSYVDLGMPEEARAVLARLQGSSKPMAPPVVAQVVLAELGRTPRQLFAEWSPQPLAAASIGQVHRARLGSGEEVAVKVQYPGIERALEADLRNTDLVDRAASLIFRGQRRGAFVDELRERLMEECDYLAEAARQEEFRGIWAGRSEVRIPRVHGALTTRRILVTDLARGDSFPAFLARASQDEKDRAGAIIFRFVFESIFRHGLFNADPHPGNYLFDGGAVTFLDFGCVKRFTAALVDDWRAMLRLTLERDRAALERLMVRIGMVPDPTRYDFDYLHRTMRVICEPWLRDGPFRFTPATVERTWRFVMVDNPNRFRGNVPKDWVLTSRVHWGLFAVLGQLGASSDWRAQLLDLLYADGAARPAPFTKEEIASSS